MTANTKRALTTSTTSRPAMQRAKMRATQDGHGTSAREGAGREAQGRTAKAGAAGRSAKAEGGGKHGSRAWHAMHKDQDESNTRWT